MKESEEILKSLAQSLAINYYNCSLSPANPDYTLENWPKQKQQIDTIFEGEIKEKANHDSAPEEWHPFGFTRNILIIGAGASKNACKKLLTGDAVAETIMLRSGIFGMLDKNPEFNKSDINECIQKTLKEIVGEKDAKNYQADRFISDAFKYLNKVENRDITLEKLINLLQFEGALQLVQGFVTKRELNLLLEDLLKYKYIPNLFYELVSHLFKHRFIDVIINLNFDEMLDNAIEDEIGDGDWIKIYNAATCQKFDKAIVEDRLRIPLYIKPHGTISDLGSILYSHTQYIDLSPSVKEVLVKVVKGVNCHNQKSESPVRQFNIISVGYAFEDPDIVAVLNENLAFHVAGKTTDTNDINDINTRLFILDLDPMNCLVNLAKTIDRTTEHILNERKNSILSSFNRSENLFCYPLKSAASDNDNINQVFKLLFEKIQNCFNKPFIPSGPARHIWNTKIINEVYIDDYTKTMDRKKLFEARSKSNILFDFYKFNGNLPMNCILSGRAGKYYKLYLSEFSKKEEATFSPIKYVLDTFFNSKFEPDDEFSLREAEFNNACFRVNHTNRDVAKKNVISTINNEIRKIQDESSESINLIDEKLSETILFSGSHEITPSYSDGKHLRFVPFNSRHIICSNLSLTWHFYKFSTGDKELIDGKLKISNLGWNKLKMISKTGSALYNLGRYQDEDTYLEQILNRNVDIEIYHSLESPVYFETTKENGRMETDYSEPKLVETYLDTINKSQSRINLDCLHPSFSNHKMVLFFNDDELKAGIYFFNPPNKTRINPVWFDNSTKPGGKNLAIMKNLYELQIKNNASFAARTNEKNAS
jgi:hypothetical protein